MQNQQDKFFNRDFWRMVCVRTMSGLILTIISALVFGCMTAD